MPGRAAVFPPDGATQCRAGGSLVGAWGAASAAMGSVPRELGDRLCPSGWHEGTVPDGLSPWIERAAAWQATVEADARCPIERSVMSVDRGAVSEDSRVVRTLRLTKLLEAGLVLRWRTPGNHEDLVAPWVAVAVAAADLARRGDELSAVSAALGLEVWTRETLDLLLHGQFSRAEDVSLGSALESLRRAEVPVGDLLAGETASTAARVLATEGQTDFAPWGLSGNDRDEATQLMAAARGTGADALDRTLGPFLQGMDAHAAALRATPDLGSALVLVEAWVQETRTDAGPDATEPEAGMIHSQPRWARLYLQVQSWTVGLRLALEGVEDTCRPHAPATVVREAEGIRARWTREGDQRSLVVESAAGVALSTLPVYHRELSAREAELCGHGRHRSPR